jgi:hypothetical protein
MSIFANSVVDLAPLVEVQPQRNYLLSALGIFDGFGTKHHKTAIGQLIEDNYSLINRSTGRFSNEHNVTARGDGKEWLVELPFFDREDEITVQDIMGKLTADRSQEETLADLSSDYVAKHYVAFARTREQIFAQSLFSGVSYSPKTQDAPLIDWADTFGIAPMSATWNLENPDPDTIIGYIDALDTQIQEVAMSTSSMIERIAVFCTPDFYSKVRAAYTSAYSYVSPDDEGNIVYQRREILPGVSTFTAPGSNVDFIKLVNPLHLDAMPEGVDAVALPIFQKGANIYQNIYGAPSGNFSLMNSGAQELYSWSYENDRQSAVRIVTENSSLAVNHGIGFSVRITAA